MIRQDDPRLEKNEWIYKYGCAYFSVLYYLNKFKNTKMSIPKIEIYLSQLKEAECFTEDMDIIWDKAFAFFGMNVSVKVVDDPKYKLKKGEFAIAKFHNPATGHSHFVPCHNGIVLFDSLGQSITCRDGAIESYRIFKEI